jgi:hypothetical protein
MNLKLMATLSLCLFTSPVMAEVEHELIRRMTVFPVAASKEYSTAADEAWWAVREVLTENQRFLVASRNFLIQKDVHQPRTELKPADAVILSKLLDAQGLVTLFLQERVFSMRVYEGEYGRLLWSRELNLNPALPVTDQLVGAVKKLTYDFIASMPYQGFVIIDPIQGTPTIRQGDHTLVKVNVGTGAQVTEGDPIQFIRVYHESIKPLFGPDAEIEVLAEGKVVSREKDILLVDISRSVKGKFLKEFSLVRIPKELQRLRDTYQMHRQIGGRVGTEYFAPEMTPVKQKISENKPLVTALTYVANLAVILLLAF